jgi:hypothetical protein
MGNGKEFVRLPRAPNHHIPHRTDILPAEPHRPQAPKPPFDQPPPIESKGIEKGKYRKT